MNDYFDNISGFELLKEGKQRKITSHETGLEELDLVTYGFPTGTITDLFGPNKSVIVPVGNPYVTTSSSLNPV